MSYQHDKHAGNHADVLKHAVLTLLIEALQQKPTPLRVLDTHAGAGRYDLTQDRAERNRAHVDGIARVLEARPVPPELVRYVEIVAAHNNGALRSYPGSPEIARSLLREIDHLELFELQPQTYAVLEMRYRRDRRVHLHRRDGFEGLRGCVPPP